MTKLYWGGRLLLQNGTGLSLFALHVVCSLFGTWKQVVEFVVCGTHFQEQFLTDVGYSLVQLLEIALSQSLVVADVREN